MFAVATGLRGGGVTISASTLTESLGVLNKAAPEEAAPGDTPAGFQNIHTKHGYDLECHVMLCTYIYIYIHVYARFF